MIKFNNTTITYNLNGQISSKVVPGVGTTTYSYDSFGNLLEVQTPTNHVKYEVDGRNRRTEVKQFSSVFKTRYVWDGQLRVIAELASNNALVKKYVYAEGVNSPEHMIFEGKKYLFVKDHRGSVNLVVNAETGEVKQKIRYSEWGEVLEDTNSGFQPFGFAGGLYDSVTKLYRFGARDYDPEIGRWLSKDPIGFEGGDTNLYGYVLQDPLNLMDFDGERVVVGSVISASPMLGGGGATVAAVSIAAIVQMSKHKGERGRTRTEHGTDNPYKHYKPHPTDKTKVIYKDPHTGKTVEKPKPKDFDEKNNCSK